MKRLVEGDTLSWFCRTSNPLSTEYLISSDRMVQSYFDLVLKKASSGEEYSDIAIFSCIDLKTNLDTVYFSPGAESIAKMWNAIPCKKPVPGRGFAKLAGDGRAWGIHFPEYVEKSRSQESAG